MWAYVLIAIIENCMFWGGLKPPLTLCIFQEKQNEEEDDEVSSNDWVI